MVPEKDAFLETTILIANKLESFFVILASIMIKGVSRLPSLNSKAFMSLKKLPKSDDMLFKMRKNKITTEIYLYAIQVSERNGYEGMFMVHGKCTNTEENDGNDANVSRNYHAVYMDGGMDRNLTISKLLLVLETVHVCESFGKSKYQCIHFSEVEKS